LISSSMAYRSPPLMAEMLITFDVNDALRLTLVALVF